jgi:hypothetical protein
MLKTEDMVILPGIIEQLSCNPEDDSVCWLTADGRIIPVRKMSDSHLAHTISMLVFTDRVRSRGVYREDGTKVDEWDRFQWAEFLQVEEARRNGHD